MKLRFLLLLLFACSCTQAPAITAAEVERRYEAAIQSHENDLSSFERSAGPGQVYAGNLAPLADYLRAVMRQRNNVEARETAATDLATLPGFGTPLTAADYTDIANTVPPASPRWAPLAQDSVRCVAEGLPADAARTLLHAMATQNPDRTTQGWALIYLAQLERREGRPDAFNEIYRQLGAYKSDSALRFSIRLLDPENKVVIGKRAPAFALRELGSDRVVTEETFRGRYYLIDLWATWCGPCVAERENITRAQDHFGGDRFTVVSISMDNAPEDAIRFRQRRWPMPWPNLYSPGSFKSIDMSFAGDVAEAYDIKWIGLPQLVLVSPEGKVVAMRDELDGPMLERTLARYLGRAH